MTLGHERYPKLDPKQTELFLTATRSLRDQAAGHAKLGKFKLAERPDDSWQDFREVYFPPVDTPNLETIANTCRFIMGHDEEDRWHFDSLLEAFRSKSATLSQAREMMSKSDRILLITPHRELIDVAMAMAACQCTIGDPELIKSTRIFAGPIVKELEIMGVPGVQALQLSSGVLVGFPDTDSTDKKIQAKEIDPTLKKNANDAMLAEFSQQIVRGEIKLSVMAPSGSTDAETEDQIMMKPVSRATNVLARRYFEAIWPVALIMDKQHTACEVGDLIRLGKGQTLHDVMDSKLAPMYARVSGKKVIYQRPENQPPVSKYGNLGGVAVQGF